MTNRAPQIFRRSSAVTLCALASLFLAACGGGGAGTDNSRLGDTVPFSERPPSGDQAGGQSTNEPQESEQASSPETDTNEPEQTASDDEKMESDPTTDDSSSSSSEPDSGGDETTTSDDSVADSEESVTVEDGSVTLEWYRPDYRENGDLIRDGEIGGYEVRYRQVGAQEAESVVLDGEWEVEYQLEGLEEGEYEFSVAAYDTNGLYSEFVSISPLQ
ncbi:fibronectin type III domain-containing protein [Marinimicrobium sp. C2-29]|uniref:fibronectin type III domain-containing protein n=1 Tax=Marinimicrobium sp. C2-29 TaxID=3139825 RepID=UPI003139106A